MSNLQPGFSNKVHQYLARQDEPITIKKLAAEALGLDTGDLPRSEYDTLSRIVSSAGWRAQKFWLPPEGRGPWTEAAS
jgi:hypothetical protein